MAAELEKTCFEKIDPAYVGTDISSIAIDDCDFMSPPRILVCRGCGVECTYVNQELVLQALYHIKTTLTGVSRSITTSRRDDGRKVSKRPNSCILHLLLSTRQYGRHFALESML
jgi:hypothetical protein